LINLKDVFDKICPRVITNVETNDSVAALTFDDGPHPVYTPQLLRILEKHKVRATFFLVGEFAKRYPEIVKMIARAGHVIGNHCWSHQNLTQVRSRLYRLKQMMACARATAPYGKRLFRPPYGAHNRQIRIDALILGYKIILWNVSAQDWTPQSSEEIAQKIIDRILPGSIFLLHDAIGSGKDPDAPRDRGPMIDGLEIALPKLKKRINFVTIPKLLRNGRSVSNWPRYSEQ
jgi:peptidoglycan/xylan/chitin deacetylase (PgdA/CDA1 family)